MKKILVAMMAVAVMCALAACGSSQSSASSSAAGSSASTAASASVASASAPSASAVSSAAASAAASGAAASAAASASAAATAPATSADGKQLATGTVVNTTFADRAAEVGYAGSDFAGDRGLLTLLVLDTPIQVTAHKGGSDYTGAVSVICLPNDEMFRQFKDKQITIGVDTWGEFPADVTGMLYDIVLDYQADGLTLVDPQS